MDFDTILFWFVMLSCLSALLRTLTNLRLLGWDWVLVYLTVLAVTGAGGWWNSPPAIYAGGILWGVTVLVPALLARFYLRWVLQQRYGPARKLAKLAGWLHPMGGWRRQTTVLRALELAQEGKVEAGLQMLETCQQTKGSLAQMARSHFYRLSQRWEEFIAWQEAEGDLDRDPQLIPLALRARGEVGDLAGLLNLYALHEQRIARLEPAPQRHFCRMVLFAFCGRRQAVEGLFAGPLEIVPAAVRELWLATADFAAGRTEEARRALLKLLPDADAITRRAMEWRLGRPPPVAQPFLATGAGQVLERAEREHEQEETFGARPSLFGKSARACQVFIALNLAVFLAETIAGGSTNLALLVRAGALVPKSMHPSDWWRLVTANFLHYGPLHLAMNMVGLWILGPFVEFTVGRRRFVLVYLISGIGAMGTVFLLHKAVGRDEILVGASACVMGLVGSMGAIMLRGWRRHNARIASRRLVSVLAIVGLQTLFDWIVPQVSMAAHLSGSVIGFLTTLLVDRGPSDVRGAK